MGAKSSEINALDSLGHAHHHLGHHDEAIACYREALDVAQTTGDRYNEIEILTHLGDSHHAAGHIDGAVGCWRRALAVSAELDVPRTEFIEAKLRGVRGTGRRAAN
jgi:tetratricopeptide (TPR) repeat protein